MSARDRIPLVLKFDDWPEADRELWEELTFRGELFLDAGPRANWSEGTVRLRHQGYGEWLSFLLRTEPEAIKEPPLARITRKRVAAYLREAETRVKPRSILNKIMALHSVANATENDEFRWLYLMVLRLQRSVSSNNVKPPLPVQSAELFAWSLRQLRELGDEHPVPGKRAAIAYRRALLVGFLAACPVRLRALEGLDMKFLELSPEGYAVHFPGRLMKDKMDRSFVLPGKLTWAIDDYLDVFRPVLLGSEKTDAFWVSGNGGRLHRDTISWELAQLTDREFGTGFRAHAFRHIAATSIAEIDPEHVGIIRDVLGHASLDMSYKHYNLATSRSANRRYQSVVGRYWKEVRRTRDRG